MADSATYDTLLIAESMIDQAPAASEAGQLPVSTKDLLNTLISSFNVYYGCALSRLRSAARQSWLSYRGAIATNVRPDIYFDELTRNLKDLTTAILAIHERMPNASPAGRSHQLKKAK